MTTTSKRVLVATEDDYQRELLAGHVKDLGFEPVTAATCDEAIEALSSGQPYITVVMTENLPGGGASTVLQKARMVDGQSPYVVMGIADPDQSSLGLYRLGAAECISAHLGLADLTTMIHNLEGKTEATLLERLKEPTLKRERGTGT